MMPLCFAVIAAAKCGRGRQAGEIEGFEPDLSGRHLALDAGDRLGALVGVACGQDRGRPLAGET